jgi:ADP-heptose:LPS heptosyltransferase
MRILVIRRDNIGDLVCTTPLFAALRKRYPLAHIAALVNSYNAAVLDGNPDIDAVHVYTKLKHRLPGQSALGILAARLKMLAALRSQVFDYVVLPKAPFDRQGLAVARQLRRREVVGFAEAKIRPKALTRPVDPVNHPALHEVEIVAQIARALDAPDALGPLRVQADPARVATWRARLPATSERNRIRVAVHISAREAGRIWPTERWIELITKVGAQGAGVVLLWSPGSADDPRHPGDDAKAADIQKSAAVLPARTENLADLTAVLSLCQAFIGADGGAMHIAAALDLPMVALFENRESKTRRWYPWRVPYEMVTPQTRDIQDIGVQDVLLAWRRLMTQAGERARRP